MAKKAIGVNFDELLNVLMTNIETEIHFGSNVLVYYSTDNVSFNEFRTATDIFKRVSKMFSWNIFEFSKFFSRVFQTGF